MNERETYTLRGPRLTVAYVCRCPACESFVGVVDFLEPHESEATFSDVDVACDGECGALFDVEWEAMRTYGDRAFVSHLVSIVRKDEPS